MLPNSANGVDPESDPHHWHYVAHHGAPGRMWGHRRAEGRGGFCAPNSRWTLSRLRFCPTFRVFRTRGGGYWRRGVGTGRTPETLHGWETLAGSPWRGRRPVSAAMTWPNGTAWPRKRSRRLEPRLQTARPTRWSARTRPGSPSRMRCCQASFIRSPIYPWYPKADIASRLLDGRVGSRRTSASIQVTRFGDTCPHTRHRLPHLSSGNAGTEERTGGTTGSGGTAAHHEQYIPLAEHPGMAAEHNPLMLLGIHSARSSLERSPVP